MFQHFDNNMVAVAAYIRWGNQPQSFTSSNLTTRQCSVSSPHHIAFFCVLTLPYGIFSRLHLATRHNSVSSPNGNFLCSHLTTQQYFMFSPYYTALIRILTSPYGIDSYSHLTIRHCYLSAPHHTPLVRVNDSDTKQNMTIIFVKIVVNEYNYAAVEEYFNKIARLL